MSTDDRGPELAAITGALLGFAALTVFLRCYVRIFVSKPFRPDDLLAIWTLASSIVYAASIVLGIQYGAGRHLDAVPTDDVPKAVQMRWVGEIAYSAAELFLKLTVGIFLLRLCPKTGYKAAVYVVMITCSAFSTFYIFLTAFQCRPVNFYWERDAITTADSTAGSCLLPKLVAWLTYLVYGVSTAGDWLLVLLSIALLRTLGLTKRQKICVTGILALGTAGSAAAAIHLYYIWKLSSGNDGLYDSAAVMIWGTVSINLGLAASSLATLQPFPLIAPFLEPKRRLLRISSDASSGSRVYGLGTHAVKRVGSQGQVSVSVSDAGSESVTALVTPAALAIPTTPATPVSPMIPMTPMSPITPGPRTPPTPPPRTYTFQSYRSYEVNRDVLARHYFPVSPREARTRWQSDGSRSYRTVPSAGTIPSARASISTGGREMQPNRARSFERAVGVGQTTYGWHAKQHSV
ncbi:hypothetical protein F4777DRAFT_574514 [Nemania sp. FL0916]|nr:hypothetical protein F4777DRAFT_574514 [Nemania sp. FL0916]